MTDGAARETCAVVYSPYCPTPSTTHGEQGDANIGRCRTACIRSSNLACLGGKKT